MSHSVLGTQRIRTRHPIHMVWESWICLAISVASAWVKPCPLECCPEYTMHSTGLKMTTSEISWISMPSISLKIALCGLRWFKLYVSNVKRCQVVKRCQILKHLDYAGGSQKKWHNEVHRYWHQFLHQIWRSSKLPKIFSKNILRVFADHLVSHQNWHQYVWTSLCQFIFWEPPP